MPEDSRGSETRARLLEAASEVFAETGYRNATFREICRIAGTNLAAVNYHFHSKERLYAAVIRRELDPVLERIPPFTVSSDDPAEKKLQTFLRSVLTSLLGFSRPTRLMKLMTREISEPTFALDLFIDNVVHPIQKVLCNILHELLGKNAHDQVVTDCARSIMAQCLIYKNSRAIIARMGHYTEYDAATIEHIADHILDFSLHGILAMADHDEPK